MSTAVATAASAAPAHQTARPQAPGRRYRLLAGRHTQKEPVLDEAGNPILDDLTGRPQTRNVTYRRGQTFTSRHDLVTRFNRPNAVKFELIEEVKLTPAVEDYLRGAPPEVQELLRAAGLRVQANQQLRSQSTTTAGADPVDKGAMRTPPAQPRMPPAIDYPLDDLTEDQLRKVAADEEVDIRGLTGKEALAAALKVHLGVKTNQPAPAPQQQSHTQPQGQSGQGAQQSGQGQGQPRKR